MCSILPSFRFSSFLSFCYSLDPCIYPLDKWVVYIFSKHTTAVQHGRLMLCWIALLTSPQTRKTGFVVNWKRHHGHGKSSALIVDTSSICWILRILKLQNRSRMTLMIFFKCVWNSTQWQFLVNHGDCCRCLVHVYWLLSVVVWLIELFYIKHYEDLLRYWTGPIILVALMNIDDLACEKGQWIFEVPVLTAFWLV